MDVVVELAHTADLTAGARDAARALLVDVFEGDITEEDWEHALGGMHVLVWEAGALIGHASVVQRRLVHRGRALRTGYLEGMGVRADRRRRGVGSAIMRAVDRVIRGGYELGALGATDEAMPLYEAFGWRRWTGPTAALTPDGIRPTPDEDSVFVLELGVSLDPREPLICDWRDGDVW